MYTISSTKVLNPWFYGVCRNRYINDVMITKLVILQLPSFRNKSEGITACRLSESEYI